MGTSKDQRPSESRREPKERVEKRDGQRRPAGAQTTDSRRAAEAERRG